MQYRTIGDVNNRSLLLAALAGLTASPPPEPDAGPTVAHNGRRGEQRMARRAGQVATRRAAARAARATRQGQRPGKARRRGA